MSVSPIILRGLLAKIESSYGVDAAPSNTTDGVRIIGPLWPELKVVRKFENLREDVVSGNFMPVKPGVPKGRYVEFDIQWEFKGKGTAYALNTDLEAQALFRSCGLSLTVDTTLNQEKITIAPVESGFESCTIWGYSGADVYKLVGCRGNVKWPWTAGQNGMIVFHMTGMLVADPTTAALPAITYVGTVTPAAVACALTMNPGSPFTPGVKTAEFDLGNKIELIEDGSGTDGLAGPEIVSRDPQFTCEIRKADLASWNPWTQRSGVTSSTLAVQLGTVQYKRLKFAATESYLIKDPEPTDYQGFNGWKLTYGIKAGFTLIAD